MIAPSGQYSAIHYYTDVTKRRLVALYNFIIPLTCTKKRVYYMLMIIRKYSQTRKVVRACSLNGPASVIILNARNRCAHKATRFLRLIPWDGGPQLLTLQSGTVPRDANHVSHGSELYLRNYSYKLKQYWVCWSISASNWIAAESS